MAAFTTRVELHGATVKDYTTLHAEMQKRGFEQTIKDDKDVSYSLPTAEYNFEGKKSRSEILDLAIEAATTTGKKHGILVTEASGRTWVGLPIAK